MRIVPSGFVKSVALIFVKRNPQKNRIENNSIPSITAIIQERSRFLFRSLGVHIARKSATIQKIERIKIVTQKLPLISFSRRLAISSGFIPKILMKNTACSGLNTTYARKLPKNITETKSIAPAKRINAQKEIGSLFFWIGVGSEI